MQSRLDGLGLSWPGFVNREPTCCRAQCYPYICHPQPKPVSGFLIEMSRALFGSYLGPGVVGWADVGLCDLERLP